MLRLIERVQQGASAVELIYTSHGRWPLHSTRPANGHNLRVAVLDSSFNPPTLAHLALASAPSLHPLSPKSDTLPGGGDYDAKLLLLSVRNADKKLAPGDATYVQRLEMMVLLAQDTVANSAGHILRDQGRGTGEANIAVAIIDEPTFVGKSKALLNFLRLRLTHATPTVEVSNPQLTFLVGMDTLERLFAPRYYGSEEAMLTSLRRFLSAEGDDARVVCARRAMGGSPPKEEERERNLMDTIGEFLESNRVAVIDIGEKESAISSTEIRQSLKQGDLKWRTFVTPSIAEYITQQNLYHPW
ncbi:Nucleotidylyl transferase [Amylocystis lapponica]|nr:Nucleotidylyl transferase [Amylocystis lapponica]